MIAFEELCAALDPLHRKAIAPSAHDVSAPLEPPTLDLAPQASTVMSESEEAYQDSVGDLDLQDISPLDEESN